jgi:hypothetical protein
MKRLVPFFISLFIYLTLVLPSFVLAQKNSVAQNPDINISLRGLTPTEGTKGLIDFDHPLDSKAPQLTTLLEGNATPAVKSLYQLHEWDSAANKASSALIATPIDVPPGGYAPVVGFQTSKGQAVLVPQSGYDIGGGYQVVVLYATDNSITLKYTPDDNVVVGYAVQLDNIRVDPQLLSLYQQANAAGRTKLPALPGGYKIGVAAGDELRVAVRDTGAFMDPRWRADWWNKVPQQPVSNLDPTLVSVDSGQKNVPPSRTEPVKNLQDEYTAACWREEYVGTIRENGAPFYRTFDGKLQYEMRADGNFNWNGATGKFGGYCGVTKSDPILLRETAPYGLKETPQCKKVEWMGEIQLNYDNPAAQSGMPIAVPFAQEIANQLEGDWSAPFVSENEMEAKAKLALEAETSGTQNSARAKAISEIQRREGVLKKILSSQKQDEMKCDLVEYVQFKGSASIYSGFTIYGRSISSVVCPPNVTKPKTFTDSERSDWEKQWGKIWSKLPLVPNETSTGDWMFSVCDDRIYHNTTKVKEVMRMGLAVNALWQALTPYAEQEKLYKNGYEDLRRPLKSKLLLGFTPKGRTTPPAQLSPPAPSYLANKTMTELAKTADKDPQCKAKETPRPDYDNGRCMHFVPTGQYDDNTLNTNVARMKDLGVTWTLALYDDENVLKRAAKAFDDAGIMAVWRKNLQVDKAPAGYDWVRDIRIMKQYGNDDVNKNGPLIQLYNEPGDDREWSNGSPNFNVYLNNFTAMSQRIMAAGGRVGIQLQDTGELVALIDKIQADSSINQKDYWNNIFFIPHLYANGNPVGWTKDEIGQLGFRPYAEVFAREIGFVPPMIVGEGGPEIKEHANDNPKFTQDMHAQYVANVYNQFATGKMVDGRPLPDYLMAFCNWIVDAAGDTRFQNYAWYNNLTVAGDLTKTINAVKSLPQTQRQFSCDKPSSVVPQGKGIVLRNFLDKVLSLFRTNAQIFAQTIEQLPLLAQAGRLLAQIDKGDVEDADPSLEVVVEVVPGTQFHYAVTIRRTQTGQKRYPGIIGDVQIYQEGGNPHTENMIQQLRWEDTYDGANTFLPKFNSEAELKQWLSTCSLKIRADGIEFRPRCVGSEIGIASSGGPGGGGSCDTTLQCCQTSTCSYKLPRSSQLGPSDTGGNFGSSTYSADHIILGVDWSGSVGGGMPLPNPVKLIWNVPGWKAGERPIPSGCSIVTEKKSPACSGPADDNRCEADAAGYDACNESKGLCGRIICMKVHDRVVDVYNSVPFLDSAWKQLAGQGSKTISSGVYNMFKSPEFKGTAAKTPDVGCTMETTMVFDPKGNFVGVPGAGEVTYSFDQGFGVGAAERNIPEYKGFGKNEVTVEQVLPADGKRSKVLFYRLGGLCNANLWLSRGMMTPLGFRNPGAMAAAGPGGVTPDGSGPGETGVPGGAGPGGFGSLSGAGSAPASTTPASVVSAATSAAGVAAILPGAPKETPRVYVVSNTLLLSRLPDFGGVAVDDHILVYEQSLRIVLYRPRTNTIVSQPSPISVSVRNASSIGGLASAALEDLRLYIPHVFVADQLDARTTTDITGISVVSVGGSGNTLAPIFAQMFGWSLLTSSPKEEPVPSADLLILIGKPSIALRNGTTDGGVLPAMEKKVQQVLPTAVVVQRSSAVDTKRTQSIIVDVSGTRPRQTSVMAGVLGVSTGALPAGEPKTSAEFLIIIGSDPKP